MAEKQQQNPEVKSQNNQQELTKENLNSMLCEIKKGNVSKEKMEHIVDYVLKLSQIESKYSEQKDKIKKDVKSFIENSVKNTLNSHLGEYNISKFDVDGQVGLDKVEEENYSRAIGESIGQIILFGGIEKFSKIHSESDYKNGFFGVDKFMASSLDMGRFFGNTKDKHFMESLIQKYGMISEEQLKEIQEKPFDITSKESRGDLAILIFKEFGDGTQDVLRFLGNIPSGLILIPRYTNYRIQANLNDPQIKAEAEIKLKELIEQNPSLAILEMLGEKGLEMFKHLGGMLSSGKQGDIAIATVTIAGLVAGGAGLTKFSLKLARKSAVKSARLAGREARLAGSTTSQATRTALKTGAQKVSKVAEVADRIDDVVGGAGIGHLTGAFGSKIKKAEKHSGISRELVLENAKLSDTNRLKKASELLGKKLTPEQEKVILYIHNEVSKGIYQNEYVDIRKMVEELDKAGISRKDGRKLMENGLLGELNNDSIFDLAKIYKTKEPLRIDEMLYEGEYIIVDGVKLPHGKGELMQDELRSIGTFENGKLIDGRIILSKGKTLEGKFVNWSLVDGEIKYPNGNYQKGTFKDGKLINGIYYFFDKNDLTSYRDGKIVDIGIGECIFNEQGILIKGRKNIYGGYAEGIFSDGKLIKGKKVDKDGIIYEGDFEKGELINGKQTYLTDGKKIEVEIRNGNAKITYELMEIGDVFDSKKELKKISKLPKSEKVQAIEHLKQNLKQQLELVADLHHEIKDFSESFDYLKTPKEVIAVKIFEKFASQLKLLPLEQRELVMKKIFKYVEKKFYAHKYMNNPKYINNSKQLLADNIGIDSKIIKRDVQAEISGSAIIFYADPIDYNKLLRPSDVSSHESIAPTGIGFMSPSSKINELGGSIVVLSGRKGDKIMNSVLLHEVQHVDNEFLIPEIIYRKNFQQTPQSLYNYTNFRGKNEISAYVRGGTRKEDIFSHLKDQNGGPYDYYKMLRDIFPEYINDSVNYSRNIGSSINIAYNINNFSNKAPNLLAITPMKKWKRLERMYQKPIIKLESKTKIYPNGFFDGTKEFERGIIFEGKFDNVGNLVEGEKKYEKVLERGKFNKVGNLIEGEIIYKDDSIIKGRFMNGELIEGEIRDVNGEITKGKFENGKLIEGEIKSVNGDSLSFRNGKPVDFGIGIFNEQGFLIKGIKKDLHGIIREGKFENGNLTSGEVKFTDGEVKMGQFLNGTLIKREYFNGIIEKGIFNEKGILVDGEIKYSNGVYHIGKFNEQGLLMDGTMLNPNKSKFVGKNMIIDGEIMPMDGILTNIDGTTQIIKNGKFIS